MKEKHLVVISVDALVYEDLEYAKTLPNFGRLLAGGSVIKRIKTIYPSLTHPVHASIITGAPAGKTGIIRNERLTPGAKEAPWYNFLSEIKCDTLLHAAKRAGVTTAVSTWPVTAKGDDVIDYLIPGVMNSYYREGVSVLDTYREYGAGECLIDIVEEGISRFGARDVHPEYDAFQVYCASELIRRYKPGLTLVHPSFVDNARHTTGLFTDRVKEAVRQTDEWLGDIFSAIEDAGISDSTGIAVISDHGQLGIVRKLSVNALLRDRGFILATDEGELISWDAYCASGALSAHVYLRDKNDKKLYSEVYEYLTELARDKLCGFERVLTTEEARELYGLDGDFSFVLETDGYTSFSEELCRPIVRGIDTGDYRWGAATHGHMPEKGPQPPFIVYGAGFKSGVALECGSILDHAPTFAKYLGLELRDAEGTPRVEVLE